MKSNLIKSAFFIIMCTVVLLVVERLVDKVYNKRSQAKVSRLFEHRIDEPIMVFGSSVAYVHIDPKVLYGQVGLSTYNMGENGNFFVQYNSMIKEYLTYEQRCKCIVVACDFDNLGKNELITRPDMYLSHLSNKFVYESLHDIEPEKIFRAKYIPGCKLGLLSKTFYRTIFIPGNGVDSNNGFSPCDKAWEVDVKNDTSFNARYDGDIYRKFGETLQLASKKGIPVILVLTPVYREGYKKIKNVADIKAKYAELAEVSPLVHLLDYTGDTICNNRKYFYNNSHMNFVGAHIFSQELGRDIKKILHS